MTTSDALRFSGTSVPVGRTGRKLGLSFDAQSESDFIDSLAGDATELCHSNVELTSVVKKKFLLTVNRRGSRAKVVLRYGGTGIRGGRSGWDTAA